HSYTLNTNDQLTEAREYRSLILTRSNGAGSLQFSSSSNSSGANASSSGGTLARGGGTLQRSTAPIQLSSLGTIIESVENNRLAGWAGVGGPNPNPQRAVLLIIFKQAGANVIE